MGKFLEAHKKDLIIFLSGAILLGSGISLGVGFSQLQIPSPEVQVEGFSQFPDQQPVSLTEPLAEFPINLNTASAAELEALPRIGSSKAAAIVAYREEHGPFKTTAEIQKVSGIGPKTFSQIKDLITIK